MRTTCLLNAPLHPLCLTLHLRHHHRSLQQQPINWQASKTSSQLNFRPQSSPWRSPLMSAMPLHRRRPSSIKSLSPSTIVCSDHPFQSTKALHRTSSTALKPFATLLPSQALLLCRRPTHCRVDLKRTRLPIPLCITHRRPTTAPVTIVVMRKQCRPTAVPYAHHTFVLMPHPISKLHI